MELDMYFYTFEQKCQLCQRWQCHKIISSETELNLLNHHTCICNLINHGGVCCAFGYKKLLSDEKELLTYLPYSPRGSNLFLKHMFRCVYQSSKNSNHTYKHPSVHPPLLTYCSLSATN